MDCVTYFLVLQLLKVRLRVICFYRIARNEFPSLKKEGQRRFSDCPLKPAHKTPSFSLCQRGMVNPRVTDPICKDLFWTRVCQEHFLLLRHERTVAAVNRQLFDGVSPGL
jgi:hypothetical protein